MRALAGLLGGLRVLAYPFAIYFGLSRWGLHRSGLVLLAIATFTGGLTLLSRRGGKWIDAARTPIIVAALVALSLSADDPRVMLALPTMVNGFLLVGFARSLYAGVPIIERFARLIDPELTGPQCVHCRSFTVVWSAFFAVNGTVAALFAIFAPFEWWVGYTGFVSYVAMGLLFAVEYLLRKYRFQQFSSLPHDRLLALILSRPSDSHADDVDARSPRQ